MFDLYTKETLNYGKHVASVTSRIDSDTNISKAMTFSGLYKKTRQQILINSELKTDSSGRQYFEVLKRSYNVTTNATGPWAGYGKRNGAMRRHKLFVRDLSRGIFLLNGEAVSLGSTSVYDQVINDIYATGVVARYEQLLNGFSQDKVETLSDNQELLFLNVFQVLKPELVEEA
jgi:hypothetical protein